MKRAVVLAAALATGACQPGLPLPGAPSRVPVEMRDFSFELPASVPAGRVVFEVVNEGARRHEIVVVPLPEDFPPLLEQLRSRSRRALETLYILPVQDPGARAAFALDLDPGRFGLVCFLGARRGRPHALRGMAAELRVTAR